MYAPAAIYLIAGRRDLLRTFRPKSRLNCFSIIDGNSNYDGVTTTESTNSDKIIKYFDHLSVRIKKKTVVVFDNAKIHRTQKVMCHRALWGEEGTFHFLSPYSPHLNLAETLWRILKGKWIKPQDHEQRQSILRCRQSLGECGKGLYVNFNNMQFN
jgi:transposase